jgi:hypothetical protein
MQTKSNLGDRLYLKYQRMLTYNIELAELENSWLINIFLTFSAV